MHKQFIFIFGGAIGDALLGAHLGRTLAAALPGARLHMISTRKNEFVRELLAPLPFLFYEEMLKNRLSSWQRLFSLMNTSHAVAYWAPFQSQIPLWWWVIARVATLRRDSVEVRCQIDDRPAPARVRVIQYDSRTDNIFSVVTSVLHTWEMKDVLTLQPCLEAPKDCAFARRPFILFHFFAGAYRRSFPIEKVQPLLKAARKRFPAHEFVLTCAHEEEWAARQMAKDIVDTRVEVNPHAQELLCLLHQSSVCVGVASGVTHIASHLGVPTVALCNLSDPCWLPTYAKNTVQLSAHERCGCHGDKTGVCEEATLGGLVYRCLYDITTERIIEEMEHLVNGREEKI